MTIQLLPHDFDEQVAAAVRLFWASRSNSSGTQDAARGHVIAGKNLDGFLEVVRSVAKHCGLPETSVFTSGRRDLSLPGYYRPAKNWDVVIVHQKRLIAVLEFKSQVGSFGNNFNNRTEEVIGNASDLWIAARHGAYLPTNHVGSLDGESIEDPRLPFLGYMMLLEECAASTNPVEINSQHYKIFPEFVGSSYADRYKLLCDRLMEQNLYNAAALILSSQKTDNQGLAYCCLSSATSIRNLFALLAGQLLAAVQS
ncbi:MAG: PaeR7I family type II restriction endonuclease [Myxococcales bacterium]|jgi:hypothetical protein|nr:PaeR7I family type II restriction endonuclease [Myxococcales bacterium]